MPQSSTNGITPGYNSASSWAPNGTGDSSLQFQGYGGVGNTDPTILTPTSNPPSFQSTVSTDYGSFDSIDVQNNGNVAYNSPPAYMPTAAQDPSASIISSMATLMNSNGAVNNDNSQFQYNINSNPPATSYTVTDNSALTSSYYGVPQQTYVQTGDVQVVDVSSNGTLGFTDYSTTVQTETVGSAQDTSLTTDYVGIGDTTITDFTTTDFDFADSSAGNF